MLLIDTIILLLILALVYRKREWCADKCRRIGEWLTEHKSLFQKIFGPVGLVIVASALFIIAGFYLRSMAAMILFLALVMFAVIRYLIHWWHTRQRKEVPPENQP